MGNIFGTSFATGGFSFDPNLSPNNQSFGAAVRAVLNALGFTGFGTSTFAVIAGTASSLAPSGFANPSVKVSTTATNGVATTAMRSDAAPALDQAASYTLTGTNTFNSASGTPITVQIGNTTAFAVVGTASLTARGDAAAGLVDLSVDAVVGTMTAKAGLTVGTGITTFSFRRVGNLVMALSGAALTGSGSSTTAFQLAPIPAQFTPSTSQVASIPSGVFTDNNVRLTMGIVTVTSSGTLSFTRGDGVALTGGPNRGIASANFNLMWVLA